MTALTRTAKTTTPLPRPRAPKRLRRGGRNGAVLAAIAESLGER